MRILFLESHYQHWGRQQHMVSLAMGLMRRGHCVEIVVRRGSQTARILRTSGLPIHELRFSGGFDPRLLYALAHLVRAQRTDFWPSILVGFITRTRIGLFQHLSTIKKRLTRQLVPRLAHRFFVVSEFQRTAFVQSGVPEHLLSILHNPIDTDTLRSHKTRTIRGEKRLRLRRTGNRGRLRGQNQSAKRGSASVRCQADRRLRMFWIGDGENIEHLKARISSQHRHRHVFGGWRNDVPSALSAVDIVVVPSLQEETFGRASAEAQAMGIPVICSDIGALRETLLPERGGLLIRPNDTKGLTQAILTLAGDDERRAAMGIVGRKFLHAQFFTAQVCERLEAYLSPCNTQAAHEMHGSYTRATRADKAN